MELKGLTHKLIFQGNEYLISEPQGFDKFSIKIKRNDYHGMSAEFSEQTLGFYGTAAGIINTAYYEDIDSIIAYQVLNAQNATLYQGVVDLSTYTHRSGKYCIVECKVAEINEKTLFNNRVDIDVDLNTQSTIDGKQLNHIASWHDINIPQKHLLYTNAATQKNDKHYTENLTLSSGYTPTHISLPLTTQMANEFGTFETENIHIIRDGNPVGTGYIFQKGDNNEFDTNFGTPTQAHIEANISCVISFLDKPTTAPQGAQNNINVTINLTAQYYNQDIDEIENITIYRQQETISGQQGGSITFSLSAVEEVTINDQFRGILLYATIYSTEYEIIQGAAFSLTIIDKSYIKMTMYDNLPKTSSNVKMLFIHEALNTITEAISENSLSVKSNYYGRPDSSVHPTNSMGHGALKAITNGYKIRRLFTDNYNERNMPLSFKNIIKSLNAIDCIGWGFSKENDTTYLRVERWDWFYQNVELLHIDSPREIVRTFSADGVITKFVIGYNKYETQDAYNSIDSIHGERTFISTIRAVSNEKNVICDFIADNYAIEKTRRAATQVNPSEEFSYDESIFVFELAAFNSGNQNLLYFIPSESNSGSTGISIGVTDTNDINRPTELINANLSPRHCAARWRDFLFAIQNNSDLKFSTGTINYKAGFTTFAHDTYGFHFLKSYAESQDGHQMENENITQQRAKFINETIEVEYPISATQYQSILSNPYGQVIVIQEACWIKELTYTPTTGLAKFTLIPSNQSLSLLQ